MQYRTEKKSDVQLAHFTTESDNSGLSISTGGADSVTSNNATVRGTAAYSVHVRVKSDYISEHRRII